VQASAEGARVVCALEQSPKNRRFPRQPRRPGWHGKTLIRPWPQCPSPVRSSRPRRGQLRPPFARGTRTPGYAGAPPGGVRSVPCGGGRVRIPPPPQGPALGRALGPAARARPAPAPLGAFALRAGARLPRRSSARGRPGSGCGRGAALTLRPRAAGRGWPRLLARRALGPAGPLPRAAAGGCASSVARGRGSLGQRALSPRAKPSARRWGGGGRRSDSSGQRGEALRPAGRRAGRKNFDLL
jgi:hypothetical protein